MTRTKAFIDLVILLVVLGSVWSLRFYGFQYIGVLSTSVGMVVSLLIFNHIRIRIVF